MSSWEECQCEWKVTVKKSRQDCQSKSRWMNCNSVVLQYCIFLWDMNRTICCTTGAKLIVQGFEMYNWKWRRSNFHSEMATFLTLKVTHWIKCEIEWLQYYFLVQQYLFYSVLFPSNSLLHTILVLKKQEEHNVSHGLWLLVANA